MQIVLYPNQLAEMENEQARALLDKYNSGQCTEAERALIEKSFFAFNEEPVEISLAKLNALKKQVLRGLPRSKSHSLKVFITISTAAAIIAFAVYMFIPLGENETSRSMRIAEQIFPKGNSALITFSNGKTIELDQNEKEIKVIEAGLTYNDGSKLVENYTTESQTISTPKGGEYKIVLSDGTKVWLNAATVLQFPTSFRGRTHRRVKLISGEAYFEVSKDKAHPFIVSTGNQNVTVLGTTFDVKAYSQIIRTTLLEGSVQLNLSNSKRNPNTRLQLKPGEQSTNDGQHIAKRLVDTDLEVAWKNGKIKFRDASLQSILAEAERWYNIDIEYKMPIHNMRLTGGISRKSNLATLLRLLKLSGINFSITEESGRNKLTIESYN